MSKKHTYQELEQKVMELEKKIESERPMSTRRHGDDVIIPIKRQFVSESEKTNESLLEERALLREALESTEDGIMVTDKEERIIHWNTKLAHMWRIPIEIVSAGDRAHLMDLTMNQLQNPEENRQRVEQLHNTLEPGFDILKFKDGRVFERLSRPLLMGQQLSGRLWVCRDVTDREKTDRDLNEQLELNKALLETFPNPVYVKNIQGAFTGCNEAFANFTGMDAHDIIGEKSIEDRIEILPETAREDIKREVRQKDNELLNNPGKQSYECNLNQSRQGTPRDFDEIIVNKATFKNADGKIIGLIGVITDITKLKRTERTLNYLLRFRKLITDFSTQFVNLSPDEIDGGITEALKKTSEFIHADWAYVFHFSENQGMIDNTYEWCAEGIEPRFEHLKGIDIEAERPWFFKQMKANKTLHFPSLSKLPKEAENERRHLQNRGVQSIIVVPLQSEGALTGFIGFTAIRSKQKWSEDIVPILNIVGEIISNALERKAADAALRKSEERLSLALEATKDGIWDWDAKTGDVFYSPQLKKMLQSEDARVPTTIKELLSRIPADQRKAAKIKVRQALQLKKSFEIEHLYHVKDNEYRWLQARGQAFYDADGMPIRTSGSVRDITDQKNEAAIRENLKNKLRESQKMEAVGTLAGGIAHEFNNALSEIYGSIELLEIDIPPDDNYKKIFEYIKSSARRMARLTSQLLAYARGGKYIPKKISLNGFMEDALSVIRHTLDSPFCIETDLSTDEIKIEADTTQLQMVLSALLTNASEAIEGNGKILVTTRIENIGPGLVKDHDASATGPYACIIVRDTGKGMNEETKSRIFEPFYTTNFQGRGLGMAAVYGIVSNHGGAIRVESELGKGTEVYVYLPIVKSKTEVKQENEVEMLSDTVTILLVEDEHIVMDVTRSLLEKLSYRVLTATTGKEAIELAEGFDGNIDLALLDIKLPDLDADEIYHHIKEYRPHLKVIVCSGYAIDGPAQKLLDAGAQDFIQKPYPISQLSDKLRKVLHG